MFENCLAVIESSRVKRGNRMEALNEIGGTATSWAGDCSERRPLTQPIPTPQADEVENANLINERAAAWDFDTIIHALDGADPSQVRLLGVWCQHSPLSKLLGVNDEGAAYFGLYCSGVAAAMAEEDLFGPLTPALRYRSGHFGEFPIRARVLAWGGQAPPRDPLGVGGDQLTSMNNGVYNGVISSNPIDVAVVAIVLFALGRRFVRRVVKAEGGDPWLAKALTACLVLHLVAAPLQIWCVNHLYGGIADYTRYIYKGAALAGGFRHFDFSLPSNSAESSTTAPSASWLGLSLHPRNQPGGRVPDHELPFLHWDHLLLPRLHAHLQRGGQPPLRVPDLLPSEPDFLDRGREQGGDHDLPARRPHATGARRSSPVRVASAPWLLILAACAGSVFVRPNEMLLVLGGFTIAMIFRPTSASTKFEPARRTTSLVFLAAMVAVVMFLTLHFLPGLHGSVNLSTINKNNQGSGGGFGSSGVTYSQSPLDYPKDVYVVLFDPLPFNAHSSGEKFQASAEHRTAGDAHRVPPKLAHLASSGLRPPVPNHVCRLRGEFLLLLRLTGQPGVDRAGGDSDGAALPRAAVHPPRPTSSPTPLHLGAEPQTTRGAQESNGSRWRGLLTACGVPSPGHRPTKSAPPPTRDIKRL